MAAYHGRVETLFVACNVQQWGTFEPATQTIQVASEAALEHEDLLDCAALHTFLNSGIRFMRLPRTRCLMQGRSQQCGTTEERELMAAKPTED